MTTEITIDTLDIKSEPKHNETQPRTAKSHYINHRWIEEIESEQALS
jgi:hypothetical protein